MTKDDETKTFPVEFAIGPNGPEVRFPPHVVESLLATSRQPTRVHTGTGVVDLAPPSQLVLSTMEHLDRLERAYRRASAMLAKAVGANDRRLAYTWGLAVHIIAHEIDGAMRGFEHQFPPPSIIALAQNPPKAKTDD